LRKETGENNYKAPIEIMDRSMTRTIVQSLYRPFLLLCLDPMCLNLCLFSSLLLSILYLFFGAFNLVFGKVYGFNLYQVGLTFVGLLVGMLLATASDPLWQRNYLRLVRNNSNKSEPEYRLPPSIGGGIITVIGLFWFAWTINPSVHWAVPLIGAGFFGGGTVLVFSGVFTFLVEAFPLYAASALAANSFARSTFAAVFPLFGLQLFNKLGFQWASSLLAFLTLVMAPFPYIFFIYGRRLRQKSRFSSTN
jgi:MFS family permease